MILWLPVTLSPLYPPAEKCKIVSANEQTKMGLDIIPIGGLKAEQNTQPDNVAVLNIYNSKHIFYL